MANVYNNLYDLNTTGLRFFTVYGPWGRPDMAYFTFTKKILNNEQLKFMIMEKLREILLILMI